jgi:4-amino-4-deoxy-L-arabinose transferase-like glycosyltransferase
MISTLSPNVKLKGLEISAKRATQILYLILIVSTIFRIGAAIYFGDQVVDFPGTYDQVSYHTLAVQVLEGQGFTFGETWWPTTAAGAPTAHWSFLYTLYLVAVYTIFGIHPLAARLIQAILVGILQPLLIYQLGKRVFNPLIGLISAALTAIYAYFIYYDACLMTEPFYITAILAGLYLAISISSLPATNTKVSFLRSRFGQGIVFGLCLGTAVLLRQLFLLIIPVIFLWMIVAGRDRLKSVLYPIIVSSAIIIVMILPFTAYNYARFGRFVLLNTNSGYAFFWGNHPIYGTHFVPILTPEMGTYQDLIPTELRSLDEAALDQELLRRGLQFVIDNPGRYLLLSISRIPAYFMFWPSADSGVISNISRVVSFGLLLPFMLYGLVRSLVNPFTKLTMSSPVVLLVLFIIIYSVVHLLSWALIRYRLPVDAVAILFAGVACGDILNWIYRRRVIGIA